MTLRDAVGILHETKNRFERRVPLVPEDVARLVSQGLAVRVQRSPTRAFTDEEFRAAGALLVDDVTDCRLLLGVKEVKTSQVMPGQTVCCFSHTIKGQAHNMPLLAHFLRVGASLVDYEVIVDDAGTRQVAFGRYAGLAGAHETLWTLGHRLAALGHRNPLAALRHAVDYPDLAAMVAHAREALAETARASIGALTPFAVAVTGEGRVSRGALEYFSLAGAERVPFAVLEARKGGALGVVHLTDRELFQRAGGAYTFEDFVARPERYVCVGAMFLPTVRALVNGLYWDARFPRLLDASTLQRMYANGTLPMVLGDIACDLHGGVEWTVRATENDAPAFVYDPTTGRESVGVEGPGVAIMAVDNLPCALPRDASVDFSRALLPYVRTFFEVDLARGVDALPAALRRAVVVAAGRLGPHHQGLETSLPLPRGLSPSLTPRDGSTEQ